MSKKVIDIIPKILENILNSDLNNISMNRNYVEQILDKHNYSFQWTNEIADDGKRKIKVFKHNKFTE